jgi:hypothetical protein
VEALFTELGGRLNTQQKEEIKKRCKEGAKKPV